MAQVKTDLGFYLITDDEYYALAKPEQDVTYVLVNAVDSQFLVVRNGQFMGKINRKLDNMKLASAALNSDVFRQNETLAGFQKSKGKTLGGGSSNNNMHFISQNKKSVGK